MDQWPHDISVNAFRKTWVLEGESLWRRVFDTHRDKMQIKNLKVGTASVDLLLRRHDLDVGITVIRRAGKVEVVSVK